jgi:hypothetical protein
MFPLFFAFLNKYIYFCTENSQVLNVRYSIPSDCKPASLLHASILLNITCQVTFVPTVHLSRILPVPAVNFCPQLQQSLFIHFRDTAFI